MRIKFSLINKRSWQVDSYILYLIMFDVRLKSFIISIFLIVSIISPFNFNISSSGDSPMLMVLDVCSNHEAPLSADSDFPTLLSSSFKILEPPIYILTYIDKYSLKIPLFTKEEPKPPNV